MIKTKLEARKQLVEGVFDTFLVRIPVSSATADVEVDLLIDVYNPDCDKIAGEDVLEALLSLFGDPEGLRKSGFESDVFFEEMARVNTRQARMLASIDKQAFDSASIEGGNLLFRIAFLRVYGVQPRTYFSLPAWKCVPYAKTTQAFRRHTAALGRQLRIIYALQEAERRIYGQGGLA
jgi:hypothetical protein